MRTCITHHFACDCREAAHAREVADLQARITAAIAALDTAPDPASDDATRREVHAIHAANKHAHAILTAGRDPESRRRAEDAA